MLSLDVVKALGNERRLQILHWLKAPRSHFPRQVDGDLVRDGVCGVLIADKLGISQPTASEHLKILSRAGLVRGKRIKQWTFYRGHDRGARGAAGQPHARESAGGEVDQEDGALRAQQGQAAIRADLEITSPEGQRARGLHGAARGGDSPEQRRPALHGPAEDGRLVYRRGQAGEGPSRGREPSRCLRRKAPELPLCRGQGKEGEP